MRYDATRDSRAAMLLFVIHKFTNMVIIINDDFDI